MINANGLIYYPITNISDEFDDKTTSIEKIQLSVVSNSMCEHSWMNTGISVQSKSLIKCTKCHITKLLN